MSFWKSTQKRWKEEPYGLTHVAKRPAGEEETVTAAGYAERVDQVAN